MVMDQPMTKVLIYGGKTGWIGGLMYDLCKEKGTWYSFHCFVRVETLQDLLLGVCEIVCTAPTVV
jgi:hypothetical protein